MTPTPEDDDGYKSDDTVVEHANLQFWRSLQQHVRRSASPSAVSATSMDEHRANPIATLTAAPTIVNTPDNTVSYMHWAYPSFKADHCSTTDHCPRADHSTRPN